MESAESNALANGGTLIGPLTARNMQLVTNQKSVYLTCQHNIVSQCRTNCIYDELPTYREISLEADFEGSGERDFNSRLHEISFEDDFDFGDEFAAMDLEVDLDESFQLGCRVLPNFARKSYHILGHGQQSCRYSPFNHK